MVVEVLHTDATESAVGSVGHPDDVAMGTTPAGSRKLLVRAPYLTLDHIIELRGIIQQPFLSQRSDSIPPSLFLFPLVKYSFVYAWVAREHAGAAVDAPGYQQAEQEFEFPKWYMLHGQQPTDFHVRNQAAHGHDGYGRDEAAERWDGEARHLDPDILLVALTNQLKRGLLQLNCFLAITEKVIVANSSWRLPLIAPKILSVHFLDLSRLIVHDSGLFIAIEGIPSRIAIVQGRCRHLIELKLI